MWIWLLCIFLRTGFIISRLLITKLLITRFKRFKQAVDSLKREEQTPKNLKGNKRTECYRVNITKQFSRMIATHFYIKQSERPFSGCKNPTKVLNKTSKNPKDAIFKCKGGEMQLRLDGKKVKMIGPAKISFTGKFIL